MRRAAVLLAALFFVMTTGCGAAMVTPPPVSVPAPAPAPGATGTVDVLVTFYAAADNDPPGSSEIAHPNARHTTAGGTGTVADPLTLATDPAELPPGTVVYLPRLQKYFVMEDDCEGCITEWRRSHRGHVDLWTSPTADPRVIPCEEALTVDGTEAIEINPPPDRPVDPRPLYDAASGRCWPHT